MGNWPTPWKSEPRSSAKAGYPPSHIRFDRLAVSTQCPAPSSTMVGGNGRVGEASSVLAEGVSATTVRLLRSAATVLSPTNEHANGIPTGGHDRALLASAGRGLDQPTAIRNRARYSYVDVGCMNGSRGFIFSDSYGDGWSSFSIIDAD